MGYHIFERVGGPGSPQPSLTVLAGLGPPVFEMSKDSLFLLLLLMFLRFSPFRHYLSVFSVICWYFSLIIVIKTLITTNPGCFPYWNRQAKNSQGTCPSYGHLSESSLVNDSPLFSSPDSSKCLFCSRYPKLGRVPPVPLPPY